MFQLNLLNLRLYKNTIVIASEARQSYLKSFINECIVRLLRRRLLAMTLQILFYSLNLYTIMVIECEMFFSKEKTGMQEELNQSPRHTSREPVFLFFFFTMMISFALGGISLFGTIILIFMKILSPSHPSSPTFAAIGIILLFFGEYWRRRIIRASQTNE